MAGDTANHERLITIMGSVLGFLLITAVSIVAWIAIQVWDMNPKVTETARRVDRIVDVLPDVKIRIAHEELSKQIVSVLLTHEPMQKPNGSWQTMVSAIDLPSGTKTIFTLPVKNEDDQTVRYMVRGAAHDLAREATSFQQYFDMALGVGENSVLPTGIDASASFAITKARYDLETRRQRLESVFGEPEYQQTFRKQTLRWQDLVAKLRAEEGGQPGKS